MPQGEGTYGSKVGRPKLKKAAKERARQSAAAEKKRTTVKKGKIVMPKVKTNLKGTDVDKIISPAAKKAVKGVAKAKSTIKEKTKPTIDAAKKIAKKMSNGQAAMAGAILGAIASSALTTRDARGRSKKKNIN